MFNSLLVKLLGFPATLIQGDLLVWDRWRWISRRARLTRDEDRLLDVGCGSGAFTIGTARRGYNSLGLSWDQENQTKAEMRARICKAPRASFQIQDVRNLAEREDLKSAFDIVLCCENIEHVIDDFALVDAMAGCLKPGGRLLLTTPYLKRRAWSFMDYGPFPDFEDGRHVRRGYDRAILTELCDHAGLRIEAFSFISGPIAQYSAYVQDVVARRLHPMAAWLVVLPLRPFAALFDRALTFVFGTTPFCIGLEAYRPRRAGAGG